ncbi:MAG: hypothetical protein FJ303_06595 [Planctomycetes bacterium]|nr:hypothetical protein [Planctomycetota bacterium]
MDLQKALTQISEIRQQVAQTETFRGYRAAPVAFSAFVACLAAGMQTTLVPDPVANFVAYLGLWIGAAVLSMAVTGLVMVWHCEQSTSSLTVPNTILAVGQFFPSVVAGGLVTYILFQHVPQAWWMLPGLWSIFFSLGVFASYRLLPRETFWVGVFYMVSGVLCLLWARDDFAFSPWAMGVPFGIGQLAAAAILYWTLERNSDEQEAIEA